MTPTVPHYPQLPRRHAAAHDVPKTTLRSLIVNILLATALVLAAAAAAIIGGGTAALIVVFTSLSLPACLLVLTIYGSPWQRTFCLGAWIPAGIALAQLAVTLMFGAENLVYGSGFRIAQEAGDILRWPHALLWIMSLFLGSLTLVLRILISPSNTSGNSTTKFER